MERKLSLEECGSAAGIQVIIYEVGKAGGGSRVVRDGIGVGSRVDFAVGGRVVRAGGADGVGEGPGQGLSAFVLSQIWDV